MPADDVFLIRHDSARFTYDDADRAARCARQTAGGQARQPPGGQAQAAGRTVVIDLAATTQTSTGALARLVALRGWLLRHGQDLRMRGPRGPAKGLYEISGLATALPQEETAVL